MKTNAHTPVPRFTESFFQQSGAVQSQKKHVLFAADDGLTVEQFVQDRELFQKCRQEYEHIIHRIDEFVRNNADKVVPKLSTLDLSRIQSCLRALNTALTAADANVDLLGVSKSDLYGLVKEQFHVLDKLLQDNNLPIKKRLDAVDLLAARPGQPSLLLAVKTSVSHLAPIIFSKEKYGSFEKFMNNKAKFEECQQEYKRVVADVAQYMENQAGNIDVPLLPPEKEDIKNDFNTFIDHVCDMEKNHFSYSVSDIYGMTKADFHELAELIKDPNIPLQIKMTELREMTPQLRDCAGGVKMVVRNAVSKLKNINLKGTVKSGYAEMAKQFAAQQAQKAPGGYLRNNEVHIGVGIYNEGAEELGLEKEYDPNKQFGVHHIAPQAVEHYKHKVREINPVSVLRVMAEQCLEMIQTHCTEAGLDVNQAFGPDAPKKLENYYKRKPEKLAELENHFGSNSVDQEKLLQSIPGSYAFKLDKTAIKLMLDFLDKLRAKDIGYVTDFAPLRMPRENSKRAGDLMLLGDMMWIDDDGDPKKLQAQDLLDVRPADVFKFLKQSDQVPQEDYRYLLQSIVQQLLDLSQQGKCAHVPAPWLNEFCTLFARDKSAQKDWIMPVMMLAASFNHVETLDSLLDNGAPVDITGNDNMTAAMLAASKGHIEILRKLLDKGADVHLKGPQGWTAAMWAARNGHEHVLKALIERGADVEEKGEGYRTALMLAAQYGRSNTVQMLIAQQANITAEDQDGRIPLMFAAEKGHVDVLKILIKESIKRGENINATNNTGNTAAMFAAEKGHVDALKALIAAGADIHAPNTNGVTAAMLAAQNGHLAVLEELIKHGADINAKSDNGTTAAMLAAQNGHVDVMKELIKRGAEIEATDNNGHTAALDAAQAGHVDVLKELITHGAKINVKNNKGANAAMLASENGHVDILKELIPLGANLNEKDNNGTTAAMLAAQKDQLDVMKELIKAGADINAKNNNGITAVMLAVHKGHLDVVKELIKAGADITVKDNNGFTATIIADQNGHVDISKELSKARINAKDDKGYTATMNAAYKDDVAALKKLIAAGADLNVRNNNGDTAVIISMKNSCYDAFAELIAAGADLDVKNNNGETVAMIVAQEGAYEEMEALIKRGANLDAKNNKGETALMFALQGSHVDVVRHLINAGADIHAMDNDGNSAETLAAKTGNADIIALITAKLKP